MRLHLVVLLALTHACSSEHTSFPDAHSTTPADGGAPDRGDATVGQSVDLGSTGLPTLPTLTNVVGTMREDSIGIDFDPVEGAADYRVYVLPKAGDVTVNADHSLTIANAVYRCAGLRQALDVPNATTNPLPTGDADTTGIESYYNPPFGWTVEIPANPIVGYVYVSAAAGLVRVYAVGVHASPTELGFMESRAKIYTTDATLRQSLLATGGRDDGIVFYVPATASAATQTMFHSETSDPTEYYFLAADKAAHATDMTPPAPAFEVLQAAAAGTQPLMATFYKPGNNHTELSVGKERWKRASNQGPGPLWHVEWSGITEPTTLVVEALASGCPFQGYVSPVALAAPPHQTLFTLAQLHSASPTGEVFINGQFDLPGTTYNTVNAGGANGAMGGAWGVVPTDVPELVTMTSAPVPIARSFLQVAPQPHDPAAWDWYQGFGAPLPAFTPAADPLCQCVPTSNTPCVGGGGGCGYWTSSAFNVSADALDAPSNVPLYAMGEVDGQLLTIFDDAYQDTGSAVRMTAAQTTSVASDSFLHVTWSVDIVGTHRRYPQVIISDADLGTPIMDSLASPDHNTLILQTFHPASPSPRFELQAFHGLVNGKPWQVNNQQPSTSFMDEDTWSANLGTTAVKPPTFPLFEHSGVDRMTVFDAYVSSSRVYTFVDGQAAGCVDLPTGTSFQLAGTTTVTFGDVLYHESATDEGLCAPRHPYSYMHEHQCAETKRHWDDLGFKAAVPAPPWDNTRFPCKAYDGLGGH